MKIHLILLDLGKVIFEYNWENTCSYWSEITGKKYEDIKQKFTFDDQQWHKFERGEVDKKAMLLYVNKQLGLKLTQKEFEDGCNAIYMEVRKGVDKFLLKLKKDYPLAALTNTNEIHYPTWKRIYADAMSPIDKFFVSHKMKCRKPEPKAYEKVIKYYKLKPEEILFLDDQPPNIDGARNCGMNAIHVISFEQMKKEVEKALKA
jgi:putative hydrolase of the HAD superfamily